jgi:hypothetical protein
MSRNPAKNTRRKPFERGNPGKPKGARRRTTVLAETLMRESAEDVTRAVIEAAKSGDMQAAKIVLDRIAPARRDNPVRFALPSIATAADAAKAMGAIVAAVSRGEFTPNEGAEVAEILEQFRKMLETSELDARIAALEERGQR